MGGGGTGRCVVVLRCEMWRGGGSAGGMCGGGDGGMFWLAGWKR